MTLPPIEHLVFSTRAAHPKSGSEFNREVVAASPGVPEAARRELVRLADMTGPVLASPELPPLWAFRRLPASSGEAASWLLVRAVSLGLYRKGHHQLLVHGLVLPREGVDLLDGDPFLLATPEAEAAGFRFVEEHPEGRETLEPLSLDPAFGAVARRLTLERLARLTAASAAEDAAFPALYDRGIADRAETTETAEPRTLVLSPEGEPAVGRAPWNRWIEWLLLHLHPADRAEVAFHTRYAYEQAIPFDWVGAVPVEVPELRRQLRGEVEVWTPASRGRGDDPGSASAPTLGKRVRQVREREPGLLPRALEGYYLTLLPSPPGGAGTDLRRNPFHPLTAEQADLCLRAELGLPLTEAEEEERLRLSLRDDGSLMRHAADLGNAWRRGPSDFERHLERLRAAARELRRLDLSRMPPIARPEERLGLLALLPALLPELLAADEEAPEPVEPIERRRTLWREIVPTGELDGVLALFHTPAEAEIGERIVVPWVTALLAADEVGGAAPPWPETLRWLGRAGRPVAPLAARVESALAERPDEDALAGFRRLERACADAGLPAFALRLLFQREIPRLDPAAARVRLGDGVAWLLREDEATTTAAAPFLGPALGDPEAAPVVLDAIARDLTRWAGAGSEGQDPGGAWERARRLLAAQERPCLPRQAAPAAGAFAARLATSPLADRTAEALTLLDTLGPEAEIEDRLAFRDEAIRFAARALERSLTDPASPVGPDGLAALLDLRLEDRPLGEPDPSLDRDLLAALVPALIVHGQESEGGAALRRRFGRYLERLLDLGRWTFVARGEWRHLLLDEILATPSPAGAGAPEDGPHAPLHSLHRAHLLLTWKGWAETQGAPDPARDLTPTLALARALDATGPTPDPRWHQALLHRAVPPEHHPEATHLLAALLPGDTVSSPSTPRR